MQITTAIIGGNSGLHGQRRGGGSRGEGLGIWCGEEYGGRA